MNAPDSAEGPPDRRPNWPTACASRCRTAWSCTWTRPISPRPRRWTASSPTSKPAGCRPSFVLLVEGPIRSLDGEFFDLTRDSEADRELTRRIVDLASGSGRVGANVHAIAPDGRPGRLDPGESRATAATRRSARCATSRSWRSGRHRADDREHAADPADARERLLLLGDRDAAAGHDRAGARPCPASRSSSTRHTPSST